jgi:hypothetical protein
MVSQRPFPRAISLLRRQQKTYDAQATGLDLHNRSGSKEMEKVHNGPVETADFFNLEMLRRHAKNYTRVGKAAGDGFARTIRSA